MANLIITVIAIALVAVASLMGAYYGGSAFLNNQSAAGASTVLNEGQQVAGAWSAYLSDHLNTAPAGLTDLTSGGYLASIPVAPAAAGGVAASAVYVAPYNTHMYMYADLGTTGATSGGTAADNNAAACLKVIKTATGTAPTGSSALTTTAAGSIASSTTYGNGTFGCTRLKTALTGGIAGSGTTAPASGDYVVEYLIQ